MSRLTRDGTAEPVSRDQILRHAQRQGNTHFPCSADHNQDWQPYLIDPYCAICDDRTYIHTYIPGSRRRSATGAALAGVLGVLARAVLAPPAVVTGVFTIIFTTVLAATSIFPTLCHRLSKSLRLGKFSRGGSRVHVL